MLQTIYIRDVLDIKTDQFSSVQSLSRVRLCDPINCSTQASLSITKSRSSLRLTSMEVSDAIQPSHPLSSPSPPAPNPSQHHRLFQWVNSTYVQISWKILVLLDTLVAQTIKNLPVMHHTRLLSLGQEDPLKQGMATHCSILAWTIPWTEEPGGLQSMGSQRVRQDGARNIFRFSVLVLTMLHKHPIRGWICVQRSLPAHLSFIPKETEAHTSWRTQP